MTTDCCHSCENSSHLAWAQSGALLVNAPYVGLSLTDVSPPIQIGFVASKPLFLWKTNDRKFQVDLNSHSWPSLFHRHLLTPSHGFTVKLKLGLRRRRFFDKRMCLELPPRVGVSKVEKLRDLIIKSFLKDIEEDNSAAIQTQRLKYKSSHHLISITFKLQEYKTHKYPSTSPDTISLTRNHFTQKTHDTSLVGEISSLNGLN